jgi:hypothetical protein
MERSRKPWWWLGLLCALGIPEAANAQATGQLWGTATLDYLASERLTYQLELQPKSQIVVHTRQPTWFDLHTTPHVDYAVAPWIDVLGEVDIAFMNQSIEVNTTRVAPRVGAQLHILSRIIQAHTAEHGAAREKLPARRPIISTLLRLEQESTFYSTDAPSKSSWTLRDRLDFMYPLNRPKTTVDGCLYITSDGELFIPIDHSEKGGAVSELLIRAGLGFRQSFAFRFEALYLWDGKRNADSGVLAPQYHGINVRVKFQF